MSTLFIYMIKVSLYLIGFYLVYAIMLSRDTLYRRNRAFILLSLLLSFILPSFTLQTGKPLNIQLFGKLLSDVFITAGSGTSDHQIKGSIGLFFLNSIYSVYIIGVVTYLGKILIDLLSLLVLIFKNKDKSDRIIRFNGLNTSGFSALGYIFINSRLNETETDEIIKHERNHLRRYHFIDIIIVEIVKAFQWFNPVIYLFNRSLRAIHEYQADQECLNSGITVVNYQNLLLNQVFRSKAFNLSNSFSNPSLIKKRMIMMTKKPTSHLASIKVLIAVPVCGFVFLAISAYRETSDKSSVHNSGLTLVNTSDTSMVAPPPPPPPPPAKTKDSDNQSSSKTEDVSNDLSTGPFTVVEQMPMFPGGDAGLLRYIASHTIYPEKAKLNNIQGRVIVRFSVTGTGAVDKISVLKGVSKELDAEALRVVSTLPAFYPGKQGGKPVPVWYMVPITFTLK